LSNLLYHTTIREGQLDVFGHVNNAIYLELFEEARWEILTQRGYGLDQMLETDEGIVVLRADVKFLRELRNRDQIAIDMMVNKVTGKLCTLKQTMRKGDKVCAEATFLMGFWDMQGRKLMLPTEKWLKVLKPNFDKRLPTGE
jgi:thioesterase III